jgi:hypothetical protein
MRQPHAGTRTVQSAIINVAGPAKAGQLIQQLIGRILGDSRVANDVGKRVNAALIPGAENRIAL